MKHLGLFEGIGGFSLAARNVGWETVAWCEWNEFGQRVLKYHFPKAEGFGDITKTDFTKYANTIDIITGGFPCQPYSLAGKRKGKEDERHLWPEMLRAIREVQPRWVVGENVFGLINWSDGLVFHEVQADLEAEGYEVFPYVLPAAAVNAPHRRDRVWFVAHRNDTGNTALRSATDGNWQEKGIQREQPQSEFSGLCNSGNDTNANSAGLQKARAEQQTARIEQHGKLDGNVANTECDGVQQNETAALCNTNRNDKEQTHFGENFTSRIGTAVEPFDWADWPTQSPICGGDDGLPTRLDGITFSKWRAESIKAYGNAIVPQVAEQIFKTIIEYEKTL